MSKEKLREHIAEHWDELTEAGNAPPDETWLTRPELANRLKVPVATLAQWGGPQNRGPRYATFGRHVRYRLSDVIVWENRQFADEHDDSAPDAPSEQGEAASA